MIGFLLILAGIIILLLACHAIVCACDRGEDNAQQQYADAVVRYRDVHWEPIPGVTDADRERWTA